MLKRPITYKTFDGEKITEDFYFNISSSELIEMEMSEKDGLQVALQRIISSNDREKLINEFKRFILMSYGVKSEDGKRFVKNDELREDFKNHAAFDSLFLDLATNDNAAATFIMGVLPEELAQKVRQANPQDKPKNPPAAFKLPPPSPPK